MNMNQPLRAGFAYLVEVIDAQTGKVRESEICKNLMPLEGINHMISATMKGATQITAWYIGLYEGNYAPVAEDVMAGFPTDATETTAYSEATRRAFVAGTVASGTVDNGASRAEFTMTAPKTIYGGFMGSSSAKGSGSGVLLSAVQFPSPKQLGIGDVLRVTAGFTLASA